MISILLLSPSNPVILKFALIALIIITIGVVLRYFQQPYIIAYIIAGILLGKHGFHVITDEVLIHQMGEYGLILLLFFIGMEISLPNLLKIWKIPAFGTLLQVILSIIVVAILGLFFNWQWNRIIIIGFVISFSSSAVVIKVLQDNLENQTKLGQSVISILIMQDIIFIPILLITNYLGGNSPSTKEVVLQLIGGALIVLCILWVLKKKEFTLPYSSQITKDHEIQVFLAFIACFGFAALTTIFGLSAALGAFVGGLVFHAAKSSKWIHESLHSFRVIFVALFFISIGMMIDIQFLVSNYKIIITLLLAVLITNHLINASIIHYFGRNWKDSLYGGALLAQIGELSFVVSLSAYQINVISEFSYQLTVIIISLTLLISPFWILGTKRFLKLNKK
ncbi:cation:proton antiporter [Flavivirga aquatica]|uniref:Cation:proton antiporter n=1 Tax=Flavivirga aquatica TaxID=1849968 RepID=A0A1E5TC75_9FLAO|nr:cation:proton antiporter [Flavivirga aquatica]OEK08949.1 cation:proton antiporter [Flavivirga aquatica]